MKLALNMIVKDDTETEILYRCLASIASYVDGIFIAVTNRPSEKIEAVIHNFGGISTFYQWDKSFERARNFALDQVPDTFEYILWLDSDDVVKNAQKIPDLIKVMDARDLTAIYFDYNYDINEQTGKVNISHPRERIIKRGHYRWKGHLHETLLPQRETNNAFFKDVAIDHHPTEAAKDSNMYRNLEILENTYKEEGETHDPRTEYYLARNYFDIEEYEKAKKLMLDYLSHSGWDEERAMACNYLGLIGLYEKDYEAAKHHFLQAVSERPEWPAWYVNLAYLYAIQERFDEATHYARLFINTPMPNTSMVTIPIDDEARYYETIYLIAMGRRKTAEAKDAAEALLKLFPKSEMYQGRLASLTRLQNLVQITKGVDLLAKELESLKETEKFSALLNALPSTIEGNAITEQLRQKYIPPKIWPAKSIVYLAGKTLEEWTPKSIEKGLGGSETAIVHLAKQWVSLGYTVTVYGNCGAEEGIYDGVEYKNYYRFNRYDTFDTVVVWRAPWELDFPYKANRILLDLHDVPNPFEFTKERLERVNKIFVKSKYHRSLLPDIPDEKFIIISNGVDRDILNWNHVKRNPYKLIYSSSYDRGLDLMLTYGWPIIKKEVPEAELHIYYGWNLFDAVHRNNPERVIWKKRLMELMKQPGVFEHGRVGHKKLIEEKSNSSIHYYATNFEEIDCIGVRESAAVGCVPITTKYGALADKPYVLNLPGDPGSKDTQEGIAYMVVDNLKRPYTELDRRGFKEDARKESWSNIAKLWITHFQ